MGDRASIVVKDGEDRVYLYTHWNGLGTLATDLRDALARRERWDDAQYLARIIFCRMVREDLDGTTNFGITARLWDNQAGCPLLTVDVDQQQVRLERVGSSIVLAAWSFENFATLPDPQVAVDLERELSS